MTEDQARSLAKSLRAYWARYPATRIWAARIPNTSGLGNNDEGGCEWGVRSNIINGAPPGAEPGSGPFVMLG